MPAAALPSPTTYGVSQKQRHAGQLELACAPLFPGGLWRVQTRKVVPSRACAALCMLDRLGSLDLLSP